MTLNPRRIQTVFLKAPDHHDPSDKAAFPDRECLADLRLRRRVEALSQADDRFNSILNEPRRDAAKRSRPNPLLSDYFWRLRKRG